MNKVIIVTGGAGFIGSRLCKRLVEQNHRVISLDNYFVGLETNHIPGVEYRTGHTKDFATHITEKPEYIFHLGEYSRVEKSLTEPEVVWDLNIHGTFGVLEFARHHATKVIYAGSSTKFADGGLGRDLSPYTLTKAMNTELVKNYGTWYGVPYAITYFYNVYGPGERAGAYGTLIEIFKEKYKKGEPLTVVSPGTQERHFTHVDDIVEGLMLVGEKGEGDEFGIGSSRAHSVLEVAHMFKSDIQIIAPRPGNRMTSSIDTTRTRALGWEPKHDLASYIQEFL
jgi:UDP-glucose 4-epimerase